MKNSKVKNIPKHKTVSDRIVQFLKDHDLISKKGIEDTLGIPDSTIRRAVLGDRNIPKKHQEAIISFLKQYGYKG